MAAAQVRSGIPFAEVAKDVIVIAVMGMTGSGKSNFIQKLTGSKDAKVGDGLKSCTEKPRLHEFSLNSTKVIMIDTPGFDDTFRTDADVLQDVAEILEVTYKCNMKLTGIIYLHRIIDPRMTHGGMRNLAMFRKLCGAEPMSNVILGTTFWSEVKLPIAELRENELRTSTDPDYWAEMLEEGARMVRYDNTQQGAQAIVLDMVSRGRINLQIQTEMCDRGLSLADTQAGVALDKELAQLAKQHAEELVKVQKEMQAAIKAQDTKMHSALKRQSTKYEKKVNEMHAQQEVLKADRRNEMRALEQEFDRRLRRMESEKEEEADERLKKALAAGRMQDQADKMKKQSEYWKKREKHDKTIKWVKVGAALTTTAVSLAACIINPGAAGGAISSFVHLANAFFEPKPPADDPPAGDTGLDPTQDMDQSYDYDDGGYES